MGRIMSGDCDDISHFCDAFWRLFIWGASPRLTKAGEVRPRTEPGQLRPNADPSWGEQVFLTDNVRMERRDQESQDHTEYTYGVLGRRSIDPIG